MRTNCGCITWPCYCGIKINTEEKDDEIAEF